MSKFIRLKKNIDGSSEDKITDVEISRVNQKLRFIFNAKDSCFFCPFSENNQELWHGDVVEVFIRYGEQINTYYEFEIAPNGCIFFAQIHYSCGNFTFKPIDDFPCYTVSKMGKSYKVELIIDLEKLFNNKILKNDDLFLNLFRIDGKNTTSPLRSALNPTLINNFHCPDKMVQLSTLI